MTLAGVALRLEGPLQAWGAWSVGDDRPTLSAPTKSGVLGLVATCLGTTRRQTDVIVGLHSRCAVHVRVDRAGTRLVDDQTIQDNPNASPTRQTIQSKRTYLADASFVAVVSSQDAELLRKICEAVEAPAFVPFLGRKSCPPSVRLLTAPRCEADDAIGLFAGIEVAPRGDGVDFYLEGEVEDRRRVRVLRQRDELSGPLPRQFRERLVSHVRLATDTIDEWMPE